MGGDEVLVHGQTFPEVCRDGGLDDGTIGTGHQAPHPSQLTDLRGGAPSAGVSVHINGVEGVLLDLFPITVPHRLLGEAIHHGLSDFIVRPGPDIDDLVVLLALGHKTRRVLPFDLLDLGFRSVDHGDLSSGNLKVVNADGAARAGGVLKPGVHELVGEDHRFLKSDVAIAGIQKRRNGFLRHGLVHHVEGQLLGHDFTEQGAADGGIGQHEALFLRPLFRFHQLCHAHLHPRMEGHLTGAEGPAHFPHVGESHAFPGDVNGFPGHVVEPEHHVLGRHDDRLAARRGQDVVRGHHQRPRLELGFEGQGHVHSHLVAVEVRVVCRANEGVKLNGLPFNQHGFEGLNAETVQRWRPVQKHRVFADDVGEDIPHLRGLPLNHLLRCFDGGRQAAGLELAEDKGLEELKGHFLRQTALVQLEGRPHHDHGSARVINALPEQVLTETTLLTLDHVREGLQGPLVRTGNGTTATTVIQQRIHRFLQHALFVAYDDVRRAEVQQALQTVIPVDHPPI